MHLINFLPFLSVLSGIAIAGASAQPDEGSKLARREWQLINGGYYDFPAPPKGKGKGRGPKLAARSQLTKENIDSSLPSLEGSEKRLTRREWQLIAGGYYDFPAPPKGKGKGRGPKLAARSQLTNENIESSIPSLEGSEKRLTRREWQLIAGGYYDFPTPPKGKGKGRGPKLSARAEN